MPKPNKFSPLGAALKGEFLPEQIEDDEPKTVEQPQVISPTPAPASTPTEPTRKGRAKGKRSDPNYLQVGAYIPKALDKQIKRLLLDEEMDFSDLVTKLLEDWVSGKSAK